MSHGKYMIERYLKAKAIVYKLKLKFNLVTGMSQDVILDWVSIFHQNNRTLAATIWFPDNLLASLEIAFKKIALEEITLRD